MIKANETIYKSIFENTKEMFTVADYNTHNYLFVNGYELYGYSHNEMIQKQLYSFIVPPTEKKLANLIKQKSEEYEQTGIVPNFAYRKLMQHKEGYNFWVESSMQLIPDESGKLIQIVSVDRNIDDIVKVEYALLNENERLQTLADNIPNGFMHRLHLKSSVLKQPEAEEIWANNLKLIYASAQWDKITNIPLADAMKDYSIVFGKIHHHDIKDLDKSMFDSLCQGKPLLKEIRYFRTNEDMRWILISMWSFAEKQQIIIDGIYFDITERKLAENQLAEYRNNLENIVKERTDELNTTNEELAAANEELAATNEELSATNEELDRYKTNLEEMVADRAIELYESDSKQRFIFDIHVF